MREKLEELRKKYPSELTKKSYTKIMNIFKIKLNLDSK